MILKSAWLVMVLTFAVPRAVAAADLRIKDSRGTEVTLTNAGIDYGGFLGPQKEMRGIRVLQGDGEVLLLWSDVVSVTVVRQDEGVKPPRVELEVVLTNGRRVPADLFRQGNMRLLGRSELGDYSIDLDKVRSIAPVAR
jgi:hypothetical protein